MSDKFYIISPNGRERLEANTKEEALIEFRKHWAQDALWYLKQKPITRLIHQQEIQIDHNSDLLWKPL